MYNCEVKKIDKPFFLTKYNLSEVNEEEWKKIDCYKRTFILTDKPRLEYLRYPGFCFKTYEDSIIYFNNVYSKIYNIFTPPRGNLCGNIVFMGIKPGSFQLQKLKDQSIVSECSWLLGPSSQRLNVALYKCKIYPYFTNVYHTHKAELDGSIEPCFQELEVLFRIHKRLNLFFMGNYNEFDRIITKLSSSKYEFDFHRIWHPSYILRMGDSNFNEWIKRIKNCF